MTLSIRIASKIIGLLGTLALVGPGSAAAAEDGVTDAKIMIGMSTALSGASADLGTNVKAGVEAYFASVNKSGGVHGRALELVAIDDGYEPDKSAANTRKLIEQDKVFALLGYVGTPTAKAAVPVAAKADVPYLFPFTGAEFLRAPLIKQVFNLRASYFDETEALIAYFADKNAAKDVAVFVQDDAYGDAGKSGVVKALMKRKLTLKAEGRYKRNTADVRAGIDEVLVKAPQVIVMVGSYTACAAATKYAESKGFKGKFANVSFVGTESLARELGSAGAGTIVSQVMPHPITSPLPLAQEFRQAMQAAGKEGHLTYMAMEGYADAKLFVEALRSIGKDPTRSALTRALEAFKADLGGIAIEFSTQDHQGSSTVFLTELKGGNAVEL